MRTMRIRGGSGVVRSCDRKVTFHALGAGGACREACDGGMANANRRAVAHLKDENARGWVTVTRSTMRDSGTQGLREVAPAPRRDIDTLTRVPKSLSP